MLERLSLDATYNFADGVRMRWLCEMPHPGPACAHFLHQFLPRVVEDTKMEPSRGCFPRRSLGAFGAKGVCKAGVIEIAEVGAA